MIHLFKYMQKRDWALMGVSLIFIVVQVYLDLRLPDYMAIITQLVSAPGSSMGLVLQNGLWMLLCGLGSLASSFVVAGFAARVASNFSARLRALQFERIMAYSLAEIKGFSTASLITRSTNDVTQLQMIIAMGLQVSIKAPIMATWAIVKIAGKGMEWTVATGVSVLLLMGLVLLVMLFAIPKFRRVQELTDNLNRSTREGLLGLRVVRAYNAEEYQSRKFEEANEALTSNNLSAQRVMSMMYPGMGLIMSGLSLAIYWLGAYMIESAGLAAKLPMFADMVVFINYAMQVVMSFMMVSMIFIMLPRAEVSAKRICEVIEREASLQDGPRSEGEPTQEGNLEFRHVSFRYPEADEYVLRDVSFSVKKGQTVAFIGATGSGKSSLINLVPRFYDVSEGAILVEGVDVREYSQEALHKKFGYVSQKALLFSGTVFSNVAYGQSPREAYTEEDVARAINIAQGSDFVDSLPGRYQGEIDRAGANLSGGQKQRLATARAICRDPAFYLFDDSFSALDYRTEKKLRHVLQENTKGATTLLVAQRIGTILEADCIVVLEEGRVVGQGRHAELMENCAEYREIALSQLSEEELGR